MVVRMCRWLVVRGFDVRGITSSAPCSKSAEFRRDLMVGCLVLLSTTTTSVLQCHGCLTIRLFVYVYILHERPTNPFLSRDWFRYHLGSNLSFTSLGHVWK